MASAETGVAALLDVALRTAETVDQEIAETYLGSLAFVLGVHGAKDIVLGNLTIEGADEPNKAVFSDQGIKIFVVHKSFKFITAGRRWIVGDDDTLRFVVLRARLTRARGVA